MVAFLSMLGQWSGNLSRVYPTFSLTAGRGPRPHCKPYCRISGDRKWMDSSHYAWTSADQRKWAPADWQCIRQFVSSHQHEVWKIMQPTENEIFRIIWRLDGLDATVSLISGTCSCWWECGHVGSRWLSVSFVKPLIKVATRDFFFFHR